MDTNGITPVFPMGNDGGFGMNGLGGIFALLILLGIFSGGFGGGFGGNNAAGFVGADVQRGFDQSTIVNGINGIQSTLNSSQMADLNRSFDVTPSSAARPHVHSSLTTTPSTSICICV